VLDDVVARVFGRDAPARARNAFTKAITGQPAVPQAAAELARMSTFRWQQKTLESSADVLQKLNESAAANGNTWLALAQVQLELGKVDEAFASVENAARHGVNRAEAARMLAMISFRSSNRDGEGAT